MLNSYARFWEVGAYFDEPWSIYRVVGEKGAALLHGQFSNHVQGLKAGSGNYNLLLTHKGKVVADLWAYRFNDDFFIFVPTLHANKVLDHLHKYTALSRVTIEDLTAHYSLVELFLPKPELLAQFPFQGLAPFQCSDTPLNNLEILSFRSDRFGFAQFDLLVRNEQKDLLCLFLNGHRIEAMDLGLREVIRVEQGVALVGEDATEANLPQEARLDSALHFEKGCYLGQEIIARLHYKGHVNKVLAGLKIEDSIPPKPATPIFDLEKEVGKISSAVFSPKLGGALALGYIPYGSNQEGKEFQVGEQKIKAQVVTLPIRRA